VPRRLSFEEKLRRYQLVKEAREERRLSFSAIRAETGIVNPDLVYKAGEPVRSQAERQKPLNTPEFLQRHLANATMTVRCTHCDWSATGNAGEMLNEQRKHAVEVHGVTEQRVQSGLRSTFTPQGRARAGQIAAARAAA